MENREGHCAICSTFSDDLIPREDLFNVPGDVCEECLEKIELVLYCINPECHLHEEPEVYDGLATACKACGGILEHSIARICHLIIKKVQQEPEQTPRILQSFSNPATSAEALSTPSFQGWGRQGRGGIVMDGKELGR